MLKHNLRPKCRGRGRPGSLRLIYNNAQLHADANLVAVDDSGGGAAGDLGAVFLEAQAASGRGAEHLFIA